MSFSSILDISSFFIGMIINLIFVALMCYYFKRKYDYLEMAQTEQAKILYQMIHKHAESSVDYTQDPLVHMESNSDSESDSDDESVVSIVPETNSDSKTQSDVRVVVEVVEPEPVTEPVTELVTEPEEIKEVVLDDLSITVNLDSDNPYNKMSMKQLKEILSSKGIRAKNNIKKDELIELISKEI
jgi:hypothetical protein